jgi:hypothetical protein
MAIESSYKSVVNVKLDAGTSPVTGNMIMRSASLGRVKEKADANKIMNVVGALIPCLAYGYVRVERTEVTAIEN